MKFCNPTTFSAGMAVAFSGIVLSASVQAQSGNAHIHGSATMNMILEHQQLFAEFQVPMASLVGFEYQPQSRIEKLKLKNAVNTLKQDKLFLFEGANCAMVTADSELPWTEGENDSDVKEHDHYEHDDLLQHDHHHEHDDEHDHHDDGHDAHHEKNHHDEDHHDQEHHGEERGHLAADIHSDIRLIYQFSCDGEVKSMSLNHFQSFSLMESIKVQMISDSGQSAASLSKSNNSLSF